MEKIMTIFAGVNGAGKTTLYWSIESISKDLGIRINADEIGRSLGNVVNVHYVGVENDGIAIKRVENRVKQGGF